MHWNFIKVLIGTIFDLGLIDKIDSISMTNITSLGKTASMY